MHAPLVDRLCITKRHCFATGSANHSVYHIASGSDGCSSPNDGGSSDASGDHGGDPRNGW